MDDKADSDNNSDSIAARRARRNKSDKHGRLSALEKLKAAKEKGAKHKYEVQDETDVYEEVDEREYSRIVQERLEDDWIVDDDGAGYVEDGREIFDEELDDSAAPAKGGKKKDEKKSKNPNIRAPGSKPKSIKSMFAAAAVKSKPKVEKDVNLKDDDLLGDIMAELHSEPIMKPVKKKMPPVPRSQTVNPFGVAKRPLPKPMLPPQLEDTPQVEEMEDAPPTPPPVVAPPKRVRTALDDLDLEPDTAQNVSKPENKQEKAKVEKKDNVERMETNAKTTNLDVSDINFDEDFEEEMQVAPAVKTLHNKENVKAAKVEKLPESNACWETSQSSGEQTVEVDTSQLPLVTNKDGEKVLRMYWLDAYEDYYKQPGIVYLFGKVYIESAKTHVSCCVAVRNIERRIYVLPRATRYDVKNKFLTDEPVSFLDLYNEFNQNIAEKYKIAKFKSKKTVMEYAFEKSDVPVQSEYLEVLYSAEYPALPSDLQGETFSCIFGTNTSSLELLLLSRKMKGPGWIDVKAPQIPNPPISWCKVEGFVTSPESVTLTTESLPPPPLVIMTFNLRTLPNPKTHQNEILAASCLVHNGFRIDKPAPKEQFQQHICAVTKPGDCVFPFDFRDQVKKQSGRMKLEIMGSERALLAFMLAKIHVTDPDVLVGHDIAGFDLEVLLHRLEANKVPYWSKIGRLKRAQMPRFSGGHKSFASANACCGRLITDIQTSAKELIRCRSYDLTELTSQLLKQHRHEVDRDQIRNYYNSSEQLLKLIECGLLDSRYILQIMYELNVLPLALQITNICGNTMARTLLGGRSERNEYLLLHAFTERNFIVPDKYSASKKQQQVQNEDDDNDEGPSKRKAGRRKPAYAGGLVLDPKKGFYDKYILLLDFNSLYPSIIQEYNICFTTVTRGSPQSPQGEDEEEHLPELPDPSLSPGVLPTEIRKLVESRKQVKQLMKAPDLTPEAKMQYDIRQKALKLTANSMYGCLGFTFSRFYAKPLAALVTSKGREILMKTKDLVQNMNLDVIYGDTDSIMINTNCTDMDTVFKIGNKVKTEVNKLYRLLEIDIDGVFKSMLLLKKKKYAALTVTKQGDTYVTQEELKGLDIVRRDWCQLAKDAGNYVVKQILSGKAREEVVDNIHSFLTEEGEQIRDGKRNIELFYITKQLTKNPEDYPDKKSLPHVQVAMRINSKGGKKLRAGDTVYYVVCEDGSGLAASQRAYHPDELSKSDSLTVDVKYYLSQQIHPVVSRLCDPIEGTDAAQIAECLGLDASGYRQMLQKQEDEEDAMLTAGQLSAEERFRDCDRLTYICPDCGKNIIIDQAFTGMGSSLEPVLSKCTNPECKSKPADNVVMIVNQLTRLIRSHINLYYQGWLRCEDSACGQRTRLVTQAFQRGHPVCGTCHRGTLHAEYTDTMLYNQLSFYHYMFDYEKATSALTDPKERDIARINKGLYSEAYRKLKLHLDHYLIQSGYSQVNLGALFQGMQIIK